MAQPTTPLPLPTTTRAEKRCRLPPLVTFTVRFTSTTCMSNSRGSGTAGTCWKPGRLEWPFRIWFSVYLQGAASNRSGGASQGREHTHAPLTLV